MQLSFLNELNKVILSSDQSLNTDQNPEGHLETISQLRDCLSMCHVRLGINYILTEENQSGEAHLLLGISWLARRFTVPRRHVSFRSASALQSTALHPRDARSGHPALVTDSKENENEDFPRPVGPLTLPAYALLALSACECCNYLALLYSGWDNHARALRCLRVGKRVYRFMRALQARQTTLLQQPRPSSVLRVEGVDAITLTHTPLPSLLLTLDSLYTHTLFYYAQVYGHLGCTVTAAKYVERTLCRQLAEQYMDTRQAWQGLEAQEVDETRVTAGEPNDAPDWTHGTSSASLDRLEWCRNALRLGSYHVSRLNWHAAALCIVAGETMLGTVVRQVRAKAGKASSQAAAGSGASAVRSLETVSGTATTDSAAQASATDSKTEAEPPVQLPEALQRLLAECAAQWAALYSALLADARMRFRAAQGDCDPPAAPSSSDFEPMPHDFHDNIGSGAEAVDAFNTGPIIRYPAQAHAAGRLRGEGEDVIDAGDSDHEGDAALLSATGQEGGHAHVHDMATFAATVGPTVAGSVISLGPGSLLHPGSLQPLSIAERVYTSSLQQLPDTAHTVPGYETARDVFKAGLLACMKALSYFVVDGYVSEHVGLQTTISSLYKHLADWEDDSKRAAAMHARQAQAIAPLLDVLNPTVYPQHHCSLSLEAGQAWRSCFEYRLLAALSKAKGAGQMTGPEFAPVAEAGEAAFRCFGHFLRCYSDPRLASVRGEWPFAHVPIGPDNCTREALPGAEMIPDAGTARAYLNVHYSIARIIYRLPFTGAVQAHATQLTHAVHRLQWTVAALGALKSEYGSFMDGEEQAMQAMVALLPQRIRILMSTGRDVPVD